MRCPPAEEVAADRVKRRRYHRAIGRLRPLLVLALLASACGQTAGAHPAAVTRANSTAPSPAPSSTPAEHVVTGPPRILPKAPQFRPPSPAPRIPGGPNISAYRGLGTWIDVYSENDVYGPQAFGDAATTVRRDRKS